MFVILFLAYSAFAGGNKELMKQAEARLRDINQQVLELISEEVIPVNGNIQLYATVKNAGSELVITELKVSASATQMIREQTLNDDFNKTSTTHGAIVFGNKVPVKQAEARLLDINKIILEHMSKETIPDNGRIHLTATIKNVVPELMITNLNVSTIESKPITNEKLLDEPNN